MLSYYDLTRQLHYDPKTGIFTWKIKKRKTRKGSEAGFYVPSRLYRYIRIDGKDYTCQRIAWFYMTKSWPTKFVGFRNKNPMDLRFLNLIHCDKYDLQSNRSDARHLTGAHFRKEKKTKPWNSRIYYKGKCISLGYFKTEKEAHKAHTRAKKDIQSGIIDFAKEVPSKWRDLLSPRRTVCESARGETQTGSRNS